ncbi:thermonuclease family protein [Mesorhizobium sp. DCY119]|uniref:thermonuclease family protein n=1 Tax=Mesorhizobium sp. DCY119 TaxID=2108445 RepID=UPI001FDEFF36|nr:thermonuclease family protein [Mesorhizobium sp. DCY119]
MSIALVGALASPAAAFELCSSSKRHTCVVDGDTVWIQGEKIRLADIDTPETEARCERERVGAAAAADRLAELLGPGAFEIKRGDPLDGRLVDRHGRTLAVIEIDGVSVGAMLVEEGLARQWTGRRQSWCD